VIFTADFEDDGETRGVGVLALKRWCVELEVSVGVG
jgi:hypothetical protein